MTANLYSIDDPALLHETIRADAKHFESKHGVKPVAVRIHPRYLNGEKVIAGLKVIADSHKAGAEYMMTSEDE